MNRARPLLLASLAFSVAFGAAPTERASAQPGTPGQGSAFGGEPVPPPGSTAETVGEPAPAPAEPAPSPAPLPTPATPSAGPATAPSEAMAPVAPTAPIAPEPALEAAEEDEDRTRAFYLEVAAGYTWIDLGQFRDDNLSPDIVRVQGSGVGVAGGLGLQVSFLTFGLQGEWSRYPDFDLGTLALDLGFRFPIPVVQPYLRAGLGYGWVLNVDEHGASAEFPEGVEGIRGLVADAGVGVDVALTDLLALNIGFDAAFLRLKRDPSSVSGFSDTDFVPDEDGEALGLQLSLLAGINLRF